MGPKQVEMICYIQKLLSASFISLWPGIYTDEVPDPDASEKKTKKKKKKAKNQAQSVAGSCFWLLHVAAAISYHLKPSDTIDSFELSRDWFMDVPTRSTSVAILS